MTVGAARVLAVNFLFPQNVYCVDCVWIAPLLLAAADTVTSVLGGRDGVGLAAGVIVGVAGLRVLGCLGECSCRQARCDLRPSFAFCTLYMMLLALRSASCASCLPLLVARCATCLWRATLLRANVSRSKFN